MNTLEQTTDDIEEVSLWTDIWARHRQTTDGIIDKKLFIFPLL